MEDHFFKETHPTADVLFGTVNESVCLQLYKERYGDVLFWKSCGLIVNKNYPWLGYSPDALIIVNGKVRLLEAKVQRREKYYLV